MRVIPNRELAPFAKLFSSATTAGASSIEARRGMVPTYRALRTGLEPSMPYEDGLAARSHEPACTLSDAIACMLFYGMSLEDGQQKVFRIWAECLVVPISYSVGHATPLTSPLASPLDSLQNLCRRSQKSRSRTRS